MRFPHLRQVNYYLCQGNGQVSHYGWYSTTKVASHWTPSPQPLTVFVSQCGQQAESSSPINNESYTDCCLN